MTRFFISWDESSGSFDTVPEVGSSGLRLFAKNILSILEFLFSVFPFFRL